MACEKIILGICFVAPSSKIGSSIFGFAEFISALALLVIVYTISDIRYKFRVAIAPAPLFKLTYFLIGVIGFGTLLTDIWIVKGWLVPECLISLPIWEGMLGGFFLLLAMIWIYYAFINPPIFSEKNYRKFAQQLYSVILKGADTELSIIASELTRSAKSLVQHARQNLPMRQNKAIGKEEKTKRTPNVGDYAHDVLLLIGNRKLCRNIIASSPVTAIAFFEEMTAQEKYELPIGPFARNISTEAILNKDSLLYHEDEGYYSGLIGYLKPYSRAIYGNYQLVESLHGSPLDINYEIVWSWDATQLKAYSRAVMITLKNFIESGNWNQHSYALYHALDNIKNSCRDVYKLNDIPSDYYSTDIYERLRVVVDFVGKVIDLIGEQQNLPSTRLRTRKGRKQWDFYDHIADLMFEIIFSAASVKTPSDKCWDIHYSSVWSNFFCLSGEGKAWGIIRFKLRRLIYDEILRLDGFPNYKSSKVLGFCLNVMGLELGDKKGYRRGEYLLQKVALAWTRKNYLRLKNIQPDVAESCLIGNISFDEHGVRLVATYRKGLNLEAPKKYLVLCPISDIEE